VDSARKHFLGVAIDHLSLQEAREKSEQFLLSEKSTKIFTPNPEMVVLAQQDRSFCEVLNSGDLNLCDGFGLSFLGGFTRITGVDFMLDLCARAEVLGKSVYLLGSGRREIVEAVALKLKEKFPALQVVGFSEGPVITVTQKRREGETLFYGLGVKTVDNHRIISQINEKRPDLLFVAYGMGKQEKWIQEFLPQCKSVKIAMGVGGSFDYIAGKVSRAPCFMRKIGLEWLYRVVREPKRLRRIFNATVVFFYYYLRSFFK